MHRILTIALAWSLLVAAFAVHAGGPASGQADLLLGLAGSLGLVALLAVRHPRSATPSLSDEGAPGPLALAAHELRTPLTAIRGYAELLQRDPPVLDAQQRAACLASIVRLCDHAAGLSAAILSAERAAIGRLALERVPCDVEAIARRTLEAAQVIHSSHRFLLEAEPDLPLARGDAEHVEAVLANLLENAAKFAPRGSTVRLEVSAVKGAMVCVRVADRGPRLPDGMPGGDAPLDQRAGMAGRKRQGLGLYIARRYVEAMGGRLWAEAAADGGAAVCFDLPLVAQAGDEPIPAGAGR